MKKNQMISFLVALAVILSFGIVYAQGEEIILKFSRDFGYASGTGKIQGVFSMKVTSSEQLTEVVFYIDDESIGKDANEPFNLQFNTNNYISGIHTLYAIGYMIDGRELKTKEEVTEFITSQESKKATLTLIVPILGLSLVAVLLSAIIPAILTKKNGSLAPGNVRNYSAAGGTICSRCNRPFSRHVFAINMLFGKLERCPHCGKWGIFRAYPMAVLRKAEESELDTVNLKIAPNTPTDENEKLRDELDDTKYQGF